MRNLGAWTTVPTLAWVLLFVAAPWNALASAKAPGLRTLTTIRAIHELDPKEAARGYPVHLKAVITYYDPFLDLPMEPFIMVTDATGSIYVSTAAVTSLPYKPGVLVEVTGESEPGFFAPDINHGKLRILGMTSLPAHPPRKTMTRLLTGSDDAQWVEVEGVVKSFLISGKNITFKLGMADGELAATTLKEEGFNYESLIDAKILIHGLAGSLFNTRRQITGLQLVFPGMSTVQVEERASEQPFQSPVSSIGSLMSYAPNNIFPHRVHIRGGVTLFWPGRLICVQDNFGAVCADTMQTTPVTDNDLIDILGFPQIGNVTPTLSDATFQTSPDRRAVTPFPINARQAFSGEYDAQLVQIEGRLVAHDMASQDPTIVVSSGTFTYAVRLPKSVNAQRLLQLEEGSELRMTGICSVQADTSILMRHNGFPIAKYFEIRLRAPDDIEVLQKPSWWTARRMLRVLAVAFAITVGILGWVILLRMRVKQQAELLGYQATHDGLTGLWNRKAVLDFLNSTCKSALEARHSIGVLMIDADHFKSINDTHGHLAGDAVLKEIAKRMRQAVRADDLIGRYGGEEFLIVLSPCTGEELQFRAEQVRTAVTREPVPLDTSQLSVTVSIGIVLLDPWANTEVEALTTADRALYQAKHAGRNCVVRGTLKPTPHSQEKSRPGFRAEPLLST